MTRTVDRVRLAQLVAIANHNYRTSIQLETVEFAISVGLTSVERLEQDALEDTRPCGKPGCSICGVARERLRTIIEERT